MRPSGVYNVTYNQDIAIVRTRLQWVLLLAFLAFLVLMPMLVSEFYVTQASIIGYTAIAMLGLQILFGYAGQISIGTAGFMAVGGFTSAIVMNRLGLNFFIALPMAGVVAALVGMVFGAPSVKIKGFYLAMATLASFFIISYVINNFPQLTGGTTGLTAPRPEIFGFVFDTETKYYYLVVTLTVLLTFLAKNIVRSKAGRAFVAVRDNDIAAEVMGINVFSYKLLAFAIGCFYAGIAGVLYVHKVEYVTIEFFQFFDNLWLLGFIVIGGMGQILGAILGAVVYRSLFLFMALMAPRVEVFFPSLSGRISSGIGIIAAALVIILFLVFEPRGLAFRWQLFKASYRLHPFAY